MTLTAALDIEYRKVIPARYTEKRDGSPMACMTCGANLVMGAAFAASSDKGWHSYCARCAADPKAQIAGLVARIEALVAPLGDNVPVEILAAVLAVQPTVEAVLGGNTSQFLNAKVGLLSVRESVGVAKRQATPDPLIDALRAIAATGHGFAQSLVAWFDHHGSLTANQRSAGERLVAEQARKAQAAAQTPAQPTAFATPAVGLYRSDDGTVRRVYTTSRRRTACRKYNGVRFAYEGNNGLRTLATELGYGTARLLTAQEASNFGKGLGRCFNCMSIGRPGRLTDDRSLAVGYGETCATHNGWWYPTAEEAGKILHGSFDLDAKLTQALTPAAHTCNDPDQSARNCQACHAGEDAELSEALDDEQDIADQIMDAERIFDEAIEDDEDDDEALADKVIGGILAETETDERQARADYDARVEHGIETSPVAPVVTPECAWCHKAPGTLSFVCEDAEAHRVCPTCRPVLVAGNRCPFH